MCNHNLGVITAIHELAELTSLKEGKRSFKAKAYTKAAVALSSTPETISLLNKKQLLEIDGVGKSVADKVMEYLSTGDIEKSAVLRSEFPAGFVRLSRVSGLGSSKLNTLRSHLGIENIHDLQSSLDNDEITNLKGFGKATSEKIRRTLESLKFDAETYSIATAMEAAEVIEATIAEHEGCNAVEITGALRRLEEHVRTIEIVAASSDTEALARDIANRFDGAEHSPNQVSFLTARLLIPVVITVVWPDEFGLTQLRLTGPTEFVEMATSNIVNEAAKDETSLFNDGFELPPPAARQISMTDIHSDLITKADIRGDLHFHSDASGDGLSSLEDMTEAAISSHLSYVVVTDHAEDLKINGLSKAEMVGHKKRIRELNESNESIEVLFGAELNIGPSGGLDYDSEFRREFDFTVASIHSHFDLPAQDQTKRLVKAISDPSVNAIGHLSGRKIYKRPGIDFDPELLVAALVKFDVALEINGSLDRLDATEPILQIARDKNVKFLINTDSHHVTDLKRISYGVAAAQRANISKDQVVNTWPLERVLEWLSLN